MLPHSKILSLGTKDKTERQIIYANVRNENFTDISRYGLFYSTDNGKTWQKSLLYSDYAKWPQLHISPHNNNEMWLFDNASLSFNSFDGGKTWHQLNVYTFPYLDGLTGFIFDPMDPVVNYSS